MTVLFSTANNESVIMASDSAITYSFENREEEYNTGAKTRLINGIGCLMTWGDRTGGQFRKLCDFLSGQGLDPAKHCVHDLAECAYRYLIAEYRPKEGGFGEVGYHVGGFDHDGRPHLYHVFWGCDRTGRPSQISPRYEKKRLSPARGQVVILYNGRNDLAEMAIHTLVNEANLGRVLRYDPYTEVGLTRFADFAVRFAAELTPQVGPPFIIRVMRAGCHTVTIRNNKFQPIDINHIQRQIARHRERHDVRTEV